MESKKNSKTRKALHAGDWYTSDPYDLKKQIDKFFAVADVSVKQTTRSGARLLKALIAPHAGLDYSGQTAAWAYVNIDPEAYDQVILLGPSHHYSLDSCAVTQQRIYETPLGNLSIDLESTQKLKNSGFSTMSKDVDEAEHSLELHLPFIKYVFGERPVKLLPILVGSLSPAAEKEFGTVLASFLQQPRTLFVVSSDFCHWGEDFDYQFLDKKYGEEIFEIIQGLDRQGMTLIEKQNPKEFHEYLETTGNTICGRHPIAVFLHALAASKLVTKTKFVQYAQSEQCHTLDDCSVSYASAITTLP